MKAEVTKIWTDLDSIHHSKTGRGFVWCVDLISDNGHRMPFSRHESPEEAASRIESLAQKTGKTIEVIDVDGHFTLSLAPECTNETAIAALRDMMNRLRTYCEKKY